MGKALGAGLLTATIILPTNATGKADFRTCKFRVMHDARYKSRICDAQCAAAIRRCMASGGKSN
jgi:hypothetical protein